MDSAGSAQTLYAGYFSIIKELYATMHIKNLVDILPVDVTQVHRVFLRGFVPLKIIHGTAQ